MNTQVQTFSQASPSAASALDVMLNTEAMTRVNDLAMVMAQAHVTVPKHLQGSVGDCFAVILQSMQWGMNPFAVAQKTHLVNGVLGYEAQLVNAVITTRAPVTGRLQFEWYGDWAKVNGKEDKSFERGVRVWATIIGEDEPRMLDISMGQVGPVRNSPMWVADPRQQLAYLATKRWSRLYAPDVIMGVYTPDELVESPEKDITPATSSAKPNTGASALKDRLKKKTEVVEARVVEVNLTPFYQRINQAESLEELDQIGAEIAELNLGEPAKSEIGEVFKAKRKELKATQAFPAESVQAVIEEIGNTADLETLNAIMESRFEPFTAQMTEEHISQINSAYEAQEAALTP